jgi:RimJ/RimL family protein N-acetyltransferase
MIQGNDIRLRAIERSDLPRFVVWLNDAEVTANLSMYLPFSLPEEESWYENNLKHPSEEHPLAIEIRQGEEWIVVGNLGLFSINWTARNAELGIFIGDKRFWNHGWGTKAMQLALRHAFNTLNLHRVYLQVFETNPRAIHVYEKVGFQVEGRKRQDVFRQGRYLDVILMSILQSEWQDSSV